MLAAIQFAVTQQLLSVGVKWATVSSKIMSGHEALTTQSELATAFGQDLSAPKWCGTGFFIISASIAVVGRPACGLQLITSFTFLSPCVNISQQQLVQIRLLQLQLALALHPQKVWNTQHSPSPGM